MQSTAGRPKALLSDDKYFIYLKGLSAIFPKEIETFLNIPPCIHLSCLVITFQQLLFFKIRVGHNTALKPYNDLHLSTVSFTEYLP